MARKPNPRSQSVAASQAQVIADGGGWVPKTLLPREEFAMWEAARAEEGTARAAILAGLMARQGASVPDILRKLANDLEKRGQG